MNSKLKVLLSVVTMSFVMVGCGGGSSDSSSTSAVDILEGKSFYYTDIYLDFEDGYYKEHFGTDLFTHTEHMPDGTTIDAWTLTAPITYSGTTVNITDDGVTQSCEVVGASTYVTITCPSRSTYILWNSIEDAKANPQ